MLQSRAQPISLPRPLASHLFQQLKVADALVQLFADVPIKALAVLVFSSEFDQIFKQLRQSIPRYALNKVDLNLCLSYLEYVLGDQQRFHHLCEHWLLCLLLQLDQCLELPEAALWTFSVAAYHLSILLIEPPT